MNRVERGWRIGLHVGMSQSNVENVVLDRRRFYEIHNSKEAPDMFKKGTLPW